jgi:hypothetical protein
MNDVTRLTVLTRHPQAYVLIDEQDGTRWRGTAEGRWVRDALDWGAVDSTLRAAVYKTREGNAQDRTESLLSDLRALLRKVSGQ